MRLLELTPEEADFLSGPQAACLQDRLARRLAAVLSARLRLPLTLHAGWATALTAPPAVPVWQPDAALATLWLTRRLGGRRPAGVAPFVSSSLIRTLDETLAECWLDAPSTLPAALAWRVGSGLGAVALSVQLPQSEIDMTRWAWGVIRHA
ncbi:MAG: hypothetical protein ACLGG6_03845 [Gammaproteobacteria bacterium]